MKDSIRERVETWAAGHGYLFGWGSPALIDDARSEIDRRRDNGEFDPSYYRTEIERYFRYASPESLKEAKSILVLVVPRTAYIMRFEMESGPFDAVVPPTYSFYRMFAQDVRDEIQGIVGALAHLEPMSAPHKLVASRIGLVAYGRNNITYSKEFGSYQQLLAFLTDIDPLDAISPSNAPSMMDECKRCRACMNACPTGAITSERFLIHCERCLTFLNEHPGPWPDWLPAGAHNAIEGCLRCQECCPRNRGKLRHKVLPIAFTRQETEVILAGVEGDAMPTIWDGIRRKIDSVDLLGLDAVISRNLRALVQG